MNRAGEQLPHLENDRSLVGSVGFEEVTAENPGPDEPARDPALPGLVSTGLRPSPASGRIARHGVRRLGSWQGCGTDDRSA